MIKIDLAALVDCRGDCLVELIIACQSILIASRGIEKGNAICVW